MARRRSAVVSTEHDEYDEIIAWYQDLLEHTPPPADLEWEPVRIGPTWQWDNGWVLPQFTLGWNRLAWSGIWLRDSKGQDWQYTAEQARFWLWHDAIDENGDFLYHSAVLQRLKGWGKDPMAACASASGMFAPIQFDRWDGDRPVGREEPNAWIQIVAVSQDQTKNTMKLFPSLIPAETRKHYGIQIGKLNIWGLGDTRHAEAVTSSPLTVEGGRPTQIIRSETQFWNSSNGGHDMAGAMEGNAAKAEIDRPARMLDICNAFRPGEDSVGERVREAWESTQGDDPTQMDFGLLYDSVEADPNAPLTSDAAPSVVKSIAGDSVWLDTRPRGRIVKSILNPANTASESRRKWYNQVTATEESWADPQDFDACADKDQVVEPGTRILMFLDCSKSDDATVLIGVRVSDGFVFTIGVWQRPPQMKKGSVWNVDRDDVDVRVNKAFKTWRPIGFFADPSDARDDDTGERYWEAYLDRWARKYGRRLQLKAVKTGPSQHAVIWDMRNPSHLKLFTEYAERTATEILERRLRHDGSVRLAQHVKNARRRPNKFGIGLGKENRESGKKVDAAVGMIGVKMMLGLAQNDKRIPTGPVKRQRVVVMHDGRSRRQPRAAPGARPR